jgi:tetratricopeptide (TPR) repeat protein
MSAAARTESQIGVGGFLTALIAELLGNMLTGGNRGLIFLVLLIATLVAVVVVHRRRRRSERSRPGAAGRPDELGAVAEQAAQWLELLRREDSAATAAGWFAELEARLRALLLDDAKLGAQRADDLAGICDALDAWYVRQRRGEALLEVAERLATVGDVAGRDDLRRVAAARAATAYRLLGAPKAAEERLDWLRGQPGPAVQARGWLERGLLRLAAADLCDAGDDRYHAIAEARDCFTEAARALPRADFAADVAVHINHAVTWLYGGDPMQAREHLRRAEVLAGVAHDASANAQVFELYGVVAWLRGYSKEAIGRWQQAERLYADLDEQVGQARCRRNLATVRAVTGPAAAVRCR